MVLFLLRAANMPPRSWYSDAVTHGNADVFSVFLWVIGCLLFAHRMLFLWRQRRCCQRWLNSDAADNPIVVDSFGCWWLLLLAAVSFTWCFLSVLSCCRCCCPTSSANPTIEVF
ncbi:unnamed protein product [Polarella glacialis]|uniref:Uncharacterized protein n=1 Tax=Polarella glacialis TaxID=89957 RepID=A0A813FI96_POLGL|nr:unnamed protein product [Polarella glacialis]